MDAQELSHDPLNEQQSRRLVVKLLAKQIDETIEVWEAKNNITAESYDQLSKMHFRSQIKSE